MVCSNTSQNGHILRPHHTTTRSSSSSSDARIYNILGNAHFDRNNFNEAIDAYHRGLEIELQKYEPTHPNVVVTLSNMGEAYRESGEFDLALQFYHEVLSIQELKLGTLCHPDICKTIQSIAMVYDQMGQLETAFSYIKHTLELQRQFNTTTGNFNISNTDANLRNFSVTLTHAGCILSRMDKISIAMNYLKEALFIQEKKNYTDDKAFTLYNIAHCHQMNGSYPEAIKCYTEALRLEEEMCKGDYYRDSSATMFKLGEVYAATGDLDNALTYFQGALEVERNKISSHHNHPGASDFFNASRILVEIAYVHYFQGNHESLSDTLRQISELDQNIPEGLDRGIRVMYQSLQNMCNASRMAAAAA